MFPESLCSLNCRTHLDHGQQQCNDDAQHDASKDDPASRANSAEVQNCANCALIQGDDGAEWRPCQIFPGKAVAAKGWCQVWAPKA